VSPPPTSDAAVETGGARTSPRLREGFRDVVVAFFLARLLLLGVSAVGGGLLPVPDGQPPPDSGYPAPLLTPGWHMLATATERQDALWFFRIAEDGYRAEDNSAAFFPLYPLVVRTVTLLPGIGPLGAGLLVSNGAFFMALLVLHALTRLELPAGYARPTVLFAAVFPTSFFFLAPYTESTFFLLSILAFWCARRDRWACAAIAGALAALTRSVGILLLPALAVEAILRWRRHGRDPITRLAATAAIALGPLAYITYWQTRFDDAFRPLDVQRAWRPDGPTSPLTSLWRAVEFAWRYQQWWLLDVAVVTLAVVGAVAIARKIPASYTVYVVASLLVPLIYPLGGRPLMSMPRFVIVLFPIYWGFARLAQRRDVGTGMLALSAAGFGVLSLLFINWYYIF
jgi:hypothetical protein